MTKSVFGNGADFWETFPTEIRFRDKVCGGKPKNPDVLLDHLKRQMDIEDSDELRQIYVEQLKASNVLEEDFDIEAAERELSEQEFYDLINKSAAAYADHALTGFLADENGLFIQSYQVEAAIKEATHILFAGQKFGKRPKGHKLGAYVGKSPKDYVAERVVVSPERIYLGRQKPDGITQITGTVSNGGQKRQVISRYEYVEQATISFVVSVAKNTDALTPDVWTELWQLMQEGGLGAARSTGHGRFNVIRWGDMRIPELEAV